MALTFTQQEIDDGKALAVVAYITVIGLVVAAVLGKDKRFCMYHVQQSLVVMLAGVVAAVLWWIPFLGFVLGGAAWLFVIVLWVIGLVHAAQGQAQPIPLVGQLGEQFNLVK